MVEKSEDGIKAYLAKRANDYWSEGEQPYLLALAASDLSAEGVSYKEVLREEKLKAFVKRTQGETGYRLVEHPTKKPKVGIVPWDAAFEFDDLEPAPRSAPRIRSIPRSGSTSGLIGFLHALSELDDEELDSVVIPTRVLVKLIRDR